MDITKRYDAEKGGRHEITHHIVTFRDFLVVAWPHLDKIIPNRHTQDGKRDVEEWMSANWEFLVERELIDPEAAITSFGYTPLAPRVTRTDKIPHHTVIALPRVEQEWPYPMRLYGFCTLRDATLNWEPPFDLAALVEYNTGTTHMLPIDALRFYLIAIDKL